MDPLVKAKLETRNDPRIASRKGAPMKRTRASERADPRMPTERSHEAPGGLEDVYSQLEQLRRNNEAECAGLRRMVNDAETKVNSLDARQDDFDKRSAQTGELQSLLHQYGPRGDFGSRLESVETLAKATSGRVDELDKSLGVKTGTGGGGAELEPGNVRRIEQPKQPSKG